MDTPGLPTSDTDPVGSGYLAGLGSQAGANQRKSKEAVKTEKKPERRGRREEGLGGLKREEERETC